MLYPNVAAIRYQTLVNFFQLRLDTVAYYLAIWLIVYAKLTTIIEYSPKVIT